MLSAVVQLNPAPAARKAARTGKQSQSPPTGIAALLIAASKTSEDALALEFTKRHAGELRYVAKWGAWLFWDGTRWKFEDTLKAFDMARLVARDAARACPSDKKDVVASAKSVAAIERLAHSDRTHAA